MSRALGAVRDPVAALASAAQGNTWSVRHGEWIVGVIGAVLIIVGLVTLVRRAHPFLGEHGAHGAIRWRRQFAVAEIVVGMVMLVGAVLSRGGDQPHAARAPRTSPVAQRQPTVSLGAFSPSDDPTHPAPPVGRYGSSAGPS